MKCKHYTGILHDFMDESLPPDTAEELRAHLEACPKCKIVFKTYELTIRLSRGAETCRDISEDEIHRLKTYLKNCILPDK